MRFTDSDIYADLLVDFDEISQAADLDAVLTERADGYVPVYYHEILTDWAEMPSEYNDSWQEFGEDASKGIFSLMSVDLFVYYQARTVAVWAEILEEKAGE